jgi:hypothetical protein
MSFRDNIYMHIHKIVSWKRSWCRIIKSIFIFMGVDESVSDETLIEAILIKEGGDDIIIINSDDSGECL